MKSFERALFSEFLATFLFVLISCGTALFAMAFVGYIGVALTFGLTLVALCAIFEKTSGCHVNPAVSFGSFMAQKIDFKTFLSYSLVQIIGGLVAAGVILAISKTLPNCHEIQSFATNGYGPFSPGNFGFWGCAVAEVLMTFALVLVCLARSEQKSPSTLSLGAILTVGHFVALPITGAGLNPARSFGVAVVEGGAALGQVWFFFVMPFIGALLAALVHKLLNEK